MRFPFSLFLFSVVAVFLSAETFSSAQDVSSDKTSVLPRPYDHTGEALDIMVQKDVLHPDYGGRLYQTHCAGCHRRDRTGSRPAPELSAKTLDRFHTIDDLHKRIKQGCAVTGGRSPDSLSDIALIYIARHIKRPLPKKSYNP